jgi:hypothetical protein
MSLLRRSVVYGRPNLEEILIVRAEARVHHWAEYMLGLPQAVDELWEWAVTRSLVDSLGPDAVHAIIAAPFTRLRASAG